jgi:acyl-CoA thioesterase-1
MNWLVFQIASGRAFFAGLALLLAAVLLRPRLRRAATWLSILGLITLGVSATALPLWSYVLLVIAVATGLVVKPSHLATTASVASLLALGALEAPYHFTPTLKPSPTRRIAIIGDSITAGYGGGDTTTKWPAILRDRHGLDVQDLSRIGETAGSATKNLRENPMDASVVVVEIGGNDLLGRTTPEGFATALDSLLAAICKPDRQVVMFELPLPPLYERFGRLQRDLAARHGVALIPKRVLLSVIEDSAATIDTIHLTQDGHERMAAVVWSVLEPAMPPGSAP